MNTNAIYHELPITSILPEGWLRRYLEIQRDGLTGHLETAQFPFNTDSWSYIGDELPYKGSWEPYEQNGYWIDGMLRCGYLLQDKFLIDKALKHIIHVLQNPDKDGYLGPVHLKEGSRSNRWVHAVFFRSVIAYYSAANDKRVLDALLNHYLSGTSTHSGYRDVCNVEIMLWLYEKTGDDRILKYAQEVYAEYNKVHSSDDTSVESMLSDRRSICHGVSYNEISKLGAVMYIYTGNKKLLDATINAYRKLDRDQMLIDGVCSSAEALLGKDPLDSHETCDIADYMWSNGYLLMATGSTEYADKIERACFNAAPGAVRSDFKGLQYFSCPNQVIADKTSNHNLYVKGHAWMSYRPNPGTPCCPGDVNRIMPNYAARMWMSSGNGNIAAVLYGPSRVNAKAGCEKKEITIVEDTSYPFSDRIDFQIRTDAPVEFNFSMRIPGWCKEAKVLLNGHKQDLAANSGSFIHLKRIFSNNDRITLILPMSLQLSHWPYEGIGIERGPLVYSLRICEDWRIDHEDNRSTEDFPAWNLYPASPWNYALAVSEKNLEETVKIIHHQVSPEPWSIDTAPIELKVPARRVSGWKIERNKSDTALIDTREGKKYIKVRGNFTPQLPDPSGLGKRLRKRMETVSLVPYGCTKLRISIFPSADGID